VILKKRRYNKKNPPLVSDQNVEVNACEIGLWFIR